MDNPLISPPFSFPKELHKLERLNRSAQANILLAGEALEEYIHTVIQIRLNLENTERDLLNRAVRLRSNRSGQVFQREHLYVNEFIR